METKNKNQFTPVHRVLHWTIAIFMGILFLTGFLRMSWMSKKTILEAVSRQAESLHITLTKEQIVPMVKSIQAPMWTWHEYAAYLLFVAFLGRAVYMLVKGVKFPRPYLKNQSFNACLQGITYLIFYLFMAVSIVTGAYLKWGDGSYKHALEAVHKWAIYWFPIFMVLHFGGIVWGELTKKAGIVSRMIGGKN